MADTSLTYSIFAKDKTGPAMKSIGGSFDKVGGLGKKMVGGIAALAGGAAVFSFTKGIIADARESAKVGRLTEAVVKSTGMAANIASGAVADLATEISNKTGVDDEAIQSGQNLLLTFTNVRNETGKGNDIFNQASQSITDMTAALNGGDVSAEKIKGSSIMLGKALNDPLKGITSLTRAGVQFTDEQKKSIETMVESGDVMGAQKVILGELETQFGGAAEAASDPAQKAVVAWGNLKEQLGGYLLPILSKVATFLSTKVIPTVSKFFDNVKSGDGVFAKIRDAIGKFAGFVTGTVLPAVKQFGDWFMKVGWPAIKNFATKLWNDLQPALKQIAKSIKDDLVPAAKGMIDKFKEAWPSIKKVLDVLAKIAGFILREVVPVLIQLYSKYLSKVISVLGTLFTWGWKIIGWLVDFGKKAWDVGVKVKDAFVRMKDRAVSALVVLSNAILGLVSGALRGFQKLLEGAGKLPKWLGGGKFDDAANAIGKIIDGVEDLKDSIAGLKDKTISLRVNQHFTSTGDLKVPGGTQLRAKGGPVSARSPYIVGEEGPEWFVPSGNGTILPNGTNPGGRGSFVGGGAQRIQVEINLTGADDDLLRRLRKQVRVNGGNVQVVLGKAS